MERKEDASAIRQLLSPDRDASGFFYILTGPAGGGKTTLAQKVIHEVNDAHPPIYRHICIDRAPLA